MRAHSILLKQIFIVYTHISMFLDKYILAFVRIICLYKCIIRLKMKISEINIFIKIPKHVLQIT